MLCDDIISIDDTFLKDSKIYEIIDLFCQDNNNTNIVNSHSNKISNSFNK